MASTSRRGLKVSDQNVKLTTTTTTTTTNSNNLLSQKSMPAILSRKRKSEHLEMVTLVRYRMYWLMFEKRGSFAL
jgi:hypothetical protein